MKKYLFSIILLLHLPLFAKAANIVFKLNSENLLVGNEYSIDVFFNRGQEEINVLEAKINVPLQLFSDISIKDGGSTVSLWVQKPELNVTNNLGVINFSAVSPSGINGHLFSILFIAEQPGTETFNFQGNALLSDGKGTKITLNPENFKLTISESTSTPENPAITELVSEKDTAVPEDFKIFVAKDSKIFNNKWFAVFNAQDKDSGIAFYESLETNDKENPENQKNWEKTTSPYLFKNQNLPKYLYIKAVDKNGNYRLSMWENPEKNLATSQQKVKIYVIITIIIVIILAIIFEIYLRKHKKQNLKS